MAEMEFSVTVRRKDGFAFTADLTDGATPELLLDEPPPLGGGQGPNAARVLAGAIGNCLAASLLLCLDKSRIAVGELAATVHVTLARNPAGRLRIGQVRVTLSPELLSDSPERFDRCLGLFEDYCIVTQSVREGIDVQVSVEPVAATPPRG